MRILDDADFTTVRAAPVAIGGGLNVDAIFGTKLVPAVKDTTTYEPGFWLTQPAKPPAPGRDAPGGSIPTWVYVAAVALAVFWLMKRGRQ